MKRLQTHRRYRHVWVGSTALADGNKAEVAAVEVVHTDQTKVVVLVVVEGPFASIDLQGVVGRTRNHLDTLFPLIVCYPWKHLHMTMKMKGHHIAAAVVAVVDNALKMLKVVDDTSPRMGWTLVGLA